MNDKRYYICDDVVSLTFSHPCLHESIQFKRNKKQKVESFLQEGKHRLILMEKFAVEKNNKISTYRSML